MDTSKVNRIEVIDHSTEPVMGRVYIYWNEYNKMTLKPKSRTVFARRWSNIKSFIRK